MTAAAASTEPDELVFLLSLVARGLCTITTESEGVFGQPCFLHKNTTGKLRSHHGE